MRWTWHEVNKVTCFIVGDNIPKTKKVIKKGMYLEVYDPSIFRSGYIVTAENVAIVGPDPYIRKWFAQVRVCQGGIVKVIA